MIRSRFFCTACRLRMEAEIAYDKRLGYTVYCYSLKSKSPFITSPINAKTGTPICPNCGIRMERFKLVQDVPDRYYDEKGTLRMREYKDI